MATSKSNTSKAKAKRPTVADAMAETAALGAKVDALVAALSGETAEPAAPKAKAKGRAKAKGGAKGRAKVAVPDGMVPVRDPDSGRHVCYVGRDPQSGELVAALCSAEGALSVAKGEGARHAFRVRKGFPDAALPAVAAVLAAEGIAAE